MQTYFWNRTILRERNCRIFPKEYQLGYYHSQCLAMGQYPPYPSDTQIATLSSTFDTHLCLPAGGKRSRGAPKKKLRKKRSKERVMIENKKRSSVIVKR